MDKTHLLVILEAIVTAQLPTTSRQGCCRHLHAITLLGCPTVNSYKRLNPRGKMNEMSWAPVYAAYGHNNRTLAARLPTNRLCLEVRHVDSATNFYLSAAMVLAAGLAGVRERLEPGEACRD